MIRRRYYNLLSSAEPFTHVGMILHNAVVLVHTYISMDVSPPAA